jgi:hypothetical protein
VLDDADLDAASLMAISQTRIEIADLAKCALAHATKENKMEEVNISIEVYRLLVFRGKTRRSS